MVSYLYDIEGTDSTLVSYGPVYISLESCLDFIKGTDSTLDSFGWETENFNWADAKFLVSPASGGGLN
jgi:hypothetical protein